MSETKFCKDCRWCIVANGEWNLATCNAPQNSNIDLVSGNSEQHFVGARACRTWQAGCGPEARWFKPKIAEAAE